MQRLVEVRHRLVPTVNRQGVLDQIVRADGEEIDLLGQPVGDEGRRRHLDHHAQRHVGIARDPLAQEVAPHLVHDGSGAQVLAHAAHHREHHPHLAVRRRAEGAAELGAEDVFALQAQPDAAQPHDGIALAPLEDGGKVLLAPEVEGADDDLVRQGRLGQFAVGAVMLLLSRQPLGLAQVQEFRAIKADPLGTEAPRGEHLLRKLDVRLEPDAQPLPCHRREIPQHRQIHLALRPPRAALAPHDGLLLRRILQDHAVGAVQHQEVAALHPGARVAQPGDGRNPEGARDDRRVRGGAAAVDRQTDDMLPVQARRVRGRQLRAHDDDVFGQLGEIVPPLAPR